MDQSNTRPRAPTLTDDEGEVAAAGWRNRLTRQNRKFVKRNMNRRDRRQGRAEAREQRRDRE